MNNVTINNINGNSPYNIFVCDIQQLNCVFVITASTSTLPVTFSVPLVFSSSPQVLVKIIDSSNCILTNTLTCPLPSVTPTISPTLTPSSLTPTPTPTITNTPSITPSITPTISITPSITPTISITPSITPTITLTASITETITPTPSVTSTITPTITPTVTSTPTPSPETARAYLFIEPTSGSSAIGQYMFNNGSTNFYGFTNGTQPSTSGSTFQTEMSLYVNYSGWTNGQFPKVIETFVPQSSGGVDSYGNPIVAYNFYTTIVSANTVGCEAWYTWIIPTNQTNSLYQTEIDISISNPNIFVGTLTEPTIYQNTFSYVGSAISNTVYRVYTSYPSSNFKLNNNTNIYFKGSVVS